MFSKGPWLAVALAIAACARPKPPLQQPVGATTLSGAPELPSDLAATRTTSRVERDQPVRQETRAEPCPNLLPSFLFAPESAVISPRQNEQLRHLAQCLSTGARQDKIVIAMGHADEPGGSPQNLELGLKRALAVRAFLLSHGVEEGRIIATSTGSLSTAASQPGRRVDLHVLGTSLSDERLRPPPIEPDILPAAVSTEETTERGSSNSVVANQP